MTEHDKEGNDKEENGKGQITIFVNNVSLTTRERELSGAQIKVLAGVPADYELFQVKGDQTLPIGADQIVHLQKSDSGQSFPLSRLLFFLASLQRSFPPSDPGCTPA